MAVISAAVDVPTTFVVQHSNQCLDVRGGPKETANGAPIEQWPCSGEANEDWTMVNTSGDLYQIKAVSSGKCIEPIGGRTANGTGIQQAACASVPRQEWKLRAKGSNGQFEIFHPKSNRCLSIRGGATATQEGAYAELRDCNGKLFQRWAKESPVIASKWTIKELPTRTASTSYYYEDLNDGGDALAKNITGAGSGSVDYATSIIHADGTISNYGTLAWQDADPAAMNNLRQFVGVGQVNTSDPDSSKRGKARAFVYANETATEIPLPTEYGEDPAHTSTYATGLNNSAQVSGYSIIRNAENVVQQTRAFLYSNGVRTDIMPPADSTATRVFAVNDAGKAVGDIDFMNGTTLPFTYYDGLKTWYPVPSSHNSGSAIDINNSGQIAGTLYNKSGFNTTNWRPFIYADGVMRKIDLPWSQSWAKATSISARGQVVGNLYPSGATELTSTNGAFLYGGGKTIDLNYLPEVIAAGIQIREALAINSSGQILARGADANPYKYYILSPVK